MSRDHQEVEGSRWRVDATPARRVWLARLLPLLAGAAQWMLWPLVQPYAWFLFYPAVFASSWIGGRAAGVQATIVSVLLVWWLFLPTSDGLDQRSVASLVPTFAFVLMGLAFSFTHARLRQSELRTRELFDQAGDGIFVADLDGRYVAVNEAGCRMLGWERHEVIGRTIADLIPPQDLPRLAQAKQALSAGATQTAEWTLLCKDGRWLPVEISAKILPGGRWQAIVRDISERRQAQAQLRLAAAVFDSTQDGLIVTDAQRRILSVNPAFVAISGPGRVPQGVVDQLEAVQVDEQQRATLTASLGARQRLAQATRELQPVRQAGERVVMGQMAQPLLRVLERGDVGEDGHVVRHGAGGILDLTDVLPCRIHLAVLALVPDLALPLTGALQRRPHVQVEGRVVPA